ncbi:MAG TPA: hypothetical protein VGS03_11110 [Candidatus Polarisedimenticolia bacterium]|nr:hypothetical protein [Candidatus Polarisedimenticolia bacterium]
MSRKPRSGKRARKVWVAAGLMGLTTAIGAAVIPNLMPFNDPTGVVATYNTAGAIDTRNPFFQSLGTNGRSCATCHAAGDAFGLSVRTVKERFATTAGHDPLFAAVDGANCTDAATGDAAAHSALLDNGLFRVGVTVPDGAQFTIRTVRDPFGCALVTDPVTGRQTVSVYRRPLPSSNLRFLSAVMWDGRETVAPLSDPATHDENLKAGLMQQSVDATLGHAQASRPPTMAQRRAIVAFELGLTSAQSLDNLAGSLSVGDASGGPVPLSTQPFHPGINDTLGGDPTGAAFTPSVFSLFETFGDRDRLRSPAAATRKAIAAGEKLFNSHPLTITRVAGLNDNPSVAAALGTTLPIAAIPGTCTTCHNTPNVGNHSLPLPLDLGVSHDPVNEGDTQVAGGLSHLSAPDVPVFEIDGCPNPYPDPDRPDAPYVISTSDPGRALITGLCADVNRVKGPVLRGLAARAPYFHNGSAATIDQLVGFYDERFQMNLTDEEKSQLVAFLNSL